MELQGFLSQIPLATDLGWIEITISPLWDCHNTVIDELNKISDDNFEHFKILHTLAPLVS